MENGHAALSVLDETAELDLLFTDLVLPGGISGSELAEQAQSRRPGLKILYTTGYAETASMMDDEPKTEVALICKPYSKTDLAQMMRAVLDAQSA